ncbi:hypothetical protein chiPu_0023767 [Chiloscyllium punctatum]|uniref:Uncharacterized protein n=1 Tax=Chiloscyllium punctatum TaxID=137246 RepID=A0A401TA87_CHIPU|nr:hypothetical protein [Chiloscyllium punctatum]
MRSTDVTIRLFPASCMRSMQSPRRLAREKFACRLLGGGDFNENKLDRKQEFRGLRSDPPSQCFRCIYCRLPVPISFAVVAARFSCHRHFPTNTSP